MASNTYYIPCCGGSCVFGYIISFTDVNYCPSIRFSVNINGINVGYYGSCGGSYNCGTIHGKCDASGGSCSNILAACSACCQICCVPTGTLNGQTTYCCEQRNTDYASERYRSASSITGNRSDWFGSTYSTFNMCQENCGCTIIRASGNNTLTLGITSVSFTGPAKTETDIRIEKVRIGGGVVAATEGRVTYSGGWSYSGSMTSSGMSFPTGSSFD